MKTDRDREYGRMHYNKNKHIYYAKAQARKDRARRFMDRYKRLLSCAHCGYEFKHFPKVCDFHHPDPSKKDGKPANMASRGWGIAHIKEELRKCIPLCANCHRIEHT